MTQTYLSSAQKLFSGLKSDVTSKSINSLTIVTSMSAGASIIGLLTKSEPKFTIFGVIYFFVLAFLGWSVTKVMSYISKNRKYEISDISYDRVTNIDVTNNPLIYMDPEGYFGERIEGSFFFL